MADDKKLKDEQVKDVNGGTYDIRVRRDRMTGDRDFSNPFDGQAPCLPSENLVNEAGIGGGFANAKTNEATRYVNPWK